ncbi:MAG: AEC family transporter [Brevinematales bacterium]|nr:AEC family transporter [Brevinematales bacterium]
MIILHKAPLYRIINYKIKHAIFQIYADLIKYKYYDTISPMEIFIKSLEAILVLIGLGFFGFYLLFKKFLKKEVLRILSPIAIEFAVPAMIFSDIILNFRPDQIQNWWLYPVYWFISFIFGIILSYFFSLFVKKESKQEFILSLVFPNAVFIPIVLISSLYGENSDMLVKLYLFTLFFPLFLFNLYGLFIDNKIKISPKIFFNPIIVITIVSVFLKIYNIDRFIPEFLIDISKRIGALSIPIILLIIGGNIYIQFEKKAEIKWKEIIFFVIVKNIIFPLIHIIILDFINIQEDIKFLIFLQSAVPPVTAIPILIEKENKNYIIANQYLFFSFIFSIISLPVMFLIFTSNL